MHYDVHKSLDFLMLYYQNNNWYNFITYFIVLLNSNRAEPSRTKPMESIRLGFRLEADSVRLDLRISSRDLVRFEPWLVDGTDEADGDDRQFVA